MAKGFCSITLGGNLGGDIEVRTGRCDLQNANFSVAVNTSQKVDGEWEDVTSWYRCVAFGKPANTLQGLSKGSYVAVAGTASTKKWKKDDGTVQENLEIKVNSIDIVVKKEVEATNGQAYNEAEMPF